MANVYYSHSTNRQGILRAILSSEEGRFLLNEYSAQYVGQQFPTAGRDPGVGFAVLRIFEGEVSAELRVGFYLFDDDVIRIEEAVRSYNAKAIAGLFPSASST
jgi:hypothetical protein